MASNNRPTSAMEARDKTYFEQQREALIGEIATNFEHVLANINKLNRSLEAVITVRTPDPCCTNRVVVGNEFSSVEALWSQFENVMAKEEEDAGKQAEQPKPQQPEGGRAPES
ncbi:hypothetical protein S7711_06181 [Stachybotrys chartarum IBT 7711]|uniref:DASH complex subunit DAD1 n=1 Tax=Stachybotrys chartarum (strain CBS 109288 / IBT 7711) TaxID=1280523 RepID=A0A084AMB2_STACB|nr:hypothetical protein S7711_06181 [Stachybotrys chartarum IBT 7711]KFA50315.1 hypothetical protein S40293_03308 [Stachybotrys chartarum IBT 40293]